MLSTAIQCVLIVALPTQVAKTEKLTPKEKAHIKQLVRELDHRERGKRDAAEKKLTAMGPKILSFLPPITRRTPAEVKVRLGRVINSIETKVAKQTAKETYVTLKGEMELAKVMQAIQKQTGNTIAGYADRDATIKVDFKKVPFWKAMDNVLDQAGLDIDVFGGEGRRLTVRARPEEQLPRGGKAVYSGPFRLEVTRLTATKNFRNPRQQGLRLSLQVTWELRVAPLSIQQAFTDVKAMGDGKVALTTETGRRDVGINPGVSATELDLAFQLPKRSIKKISKLTGTMTALVPGRTERFSFEDITEGEIERKKAGVTVFLDRVRKNGDVYAVMIRVRFDDAKNSLESHRGWIYRNEAYLVAPDGKKVKPATFEASRQDTNEVGLMYLFPLEKKPTRHKFIYETPALMMRLPIKYEIKNIELP